MATSSRRSFPGRFTTSATGVFRPTFRVPPSYKPPPGLVPEALPETPTNLSVVAGSGQVTLTWDEGYSTRRLIDYLVEYSVYGSGTWTAFTHTASVAKTIIVTGLTNGSDYQFRVSAVSIYGTSTPTDIIAATPDASIGYWGIYGSNPGISPDSVRFTGGTISIVGSYVYHVFTSSGTLGWIGGNAVTGVELQICGGGGNGGTSTGANKYDAGGGGGAGGWSEVTSLTFSSSKTVTVGGAGSQSVIDIYTAEGGQIGGYTGSFSGKSGQFGSGAGTAGNGASTFSGGATTGGGYAGGNSSSTSGNIGQGGAGGGHGAAGVGGATGQNLSATAGATRWLGIETGYGGGTNNLVGGAPNTTKANPAYGSGGCGGNGYGSGYAVTSSTGKPGIVIVRYLAV